MRMRSLRTQLLHQSSVAGLSDGPRHECLHREHVHAVGVLGQHVREQPAEHPRRPIRCTMP